MTSSELHRFLDRQAEEVSISIDGKTGPVFRFLATVRTLELIGHEAFTHTCGMNRVTKLVVKKILGNLK